MGGAGFPTAQKLRVALRYHTRHILANGVECEPQVSADVRLLETQAKGVFEGIQIVGRCLGCSSLNLVVSDPLLHEQLIKLCPEDIHCSLVPNTPANGEERRLIQLTFDETVPYEQYPTHYGFVVLNVATLFAVYESVCEGRRPTDRLVSAFGDEKWVRIGTPLSDLTDDQTRPLLLGSESTGTPATDSAKVQQETNAVSFDDSSAARECIHCGWCNEVCPKQLNVEAMLRFADSDLMPTALEQHYSACFECGACVVECPSRIPLLHAIRNGKQRLNRAAEQLQSKERFQRREERRALSVSHEEDARRARIQSNRTW